MSSSKKRRKQTGKESQKSQISDSEMTFGKIKVSALAIAIGFGLVTFTQYLVLPAAIVVSSICVLLMIPFVGFMKVFFQRAQRRLKQEHIPIMQKHVGFNTFFSNREVIFHDVILIITTLGTIAALIFQWVSVYIWAAIRVFGVYSFFVHCFYNGKVYNTLLTHEKLHQGGNV